MGARLFVLRVPATARRASDLLSQFSSLLALPVAAVYMRRRSVRVILTALFLISRISGVRHPRPKRPGPQEAQPVSLGR